MNARYESLGVDAESPMEQAIEAPIINGAFHADDLVGPFIGHTEQDPEINSTPGQNVVRLTYEAARLIIGDAREEGISVYNVVADSLSLRRELKKQENMGREGPFFKPAKEELGLAGRLLARVGITKLVKLEPLQSPLE